ncbi:MAG: dTDP-4-dehydrorhamnose reductase [Oscillospiraceae bacterium]|nr:dTDP-4-dehydrorhamnose reductase [Oscillospiraceae bacterium]
MRVLITGVSGQLGHDAAKVLTEKGIAFIGFSSRELDVTDRDAVLRMFSQYRPDAALHCAAYTKVDRAEDEAERCMRVNADGTRYIAEACRKLDAKLLYVSTDYVFPGTGDKPWETDDPTGPLNVYGLSKLAGERAVRELVEKHFIVRTSWVVGAHGNNFVKTMLRLAETYREVRVVDDQIGSPTFTADLAPLLCAMIETDKYGVYHATNEGFCSWAELAEAVFRLTGKDAAVRRVSTEEYGAKALRPKNSRLSKASLDAGGFMRLPDWESSLAHLPVKGEL